MGLVSCGYIPKTIQSGAQLDALFFAETECYARDRASYCESRRLTGQLLRRCGSAPCARPIWDVAVSCFSDRSNIQKQMKMIRRNWMRFHKWLSIWN